MTTHNVETEQETLLLATLTLYRSLYSLLHFSIQPPSIGLDSRRFTFRVIPPNRSPPETPPARRLGSPREARFFDDFSEGESTYDEADLMNP